MKSDQSHLLFEGRFAGDGEKTLPPREHIRRALLLSVFLILACTSALPQSLSIIELNHRRADELVQVIEPLLDPGERITGRDYELYLVAAPETEQRVRELVARLDGRPEQLLISVRTPQTVRNERSRIAGSLSTRDNRLSLEAEDSSVTRTREQTPQVRATEGEPALIQAGVSAPVRSVERRIQNGRVIERERVEYRPVTTGFYVTARVNGDNVLLEVRQQDDSLQVGGVVNTNRLATSVQGRLGEWIPLGGVDTEERRHDSGILYRQSTHDRRDNSVMIKVERVSGE